MTLLTPLWQQDSSYSATIDRQLIDALFSAPGVVLTGDLLCAQRAAGANMSVDVAAGKCVVTGTDISGQGKYLCASTAVTNVTINTAPGTGQSRIDLIVAQVRDQDQNGLAHNDWIITAVTGTAATTGSQVAPAAPASSLILSQIAVGPNVTTIVTANITDKRGAASLGGSASGVLASHHYAPTTVAGGANFGTTHFAVSDATNMIVPSFVLPASGKAAVVISGTINAGSACFCYLALFQHGGSTKFGPTVMVLSELGGLTGYDLSEWPFSATFVITGTPGATIPALDVYGYVSPSGASVGLTACDPGGSTTTAPTAPASAGSPFDSIVYALV